MHGLLTVGMAVPEGGLESSAALDVFSLALFWGGVLLLAIGYYYLRSAPAPKHAEFVSDKV